MHVGTQRLWSATCNLQTTLLMNGEAGRNIWKTAHAVQLASRRDPRRLSSVTTGRANNTIWPCCVGSVTVHGARALKRILGTRSSNRARSIKARCLFDDMFDAR
eukprot:7737133-Pyramimonas_sp.AAC.1